MLKIRAFRAIDEPDTCLRYMEGHARVLTDYGITSISTNNSTWKDNPSVYGVIAETEEGEVVGGVRLHLTNDLEPLPVEKAVGDQDPKIANYIYSYPLGHAAEACGLWNARKLGNLGVSILLVRALLIIAPQLKLQSIFTLCAPYTIHITKQMGSYLIESVGDNGVIIYPIINHRARFFENKDIIELGLADESNRKRILDLRQNLHQTYVEVITKQPVEISYSLSIPNVQFEMISLLLKPQV